MSGKRRVFESCGAICLLFCLLAGTDVGQAQQSAPNTPVVAWVYDDRLWVSTGEPDSAEVVAQGDILSAALSPNQKQIAYVTQITLVIIAVDSRETVATLDHSTLAAGEEPGREPGFSTPVWVSDTALLFNTLDYFEGPPGIENRHDVQRFDVAAGELTELVPTGEGGIITLSPDRRSMAVARPGSWGDEQNPGVIQVLDTVTGQLRVAPFTFGAVSTASEYRWYPDIQWSADGTAIAFVIPDSELVYNLEEVPPTQVCYLSADESDARAVCQEHFVSFPVRVVFDDTLTRLAYTRRVGALQDNSVQLVFGAAAPGEEPDMKTLPATTAIPTPVLWLDPDTLLFHESGESSRQLLAVGLDAQVVRPWPTRPLPDPVINLQRLGSDLFALAVGDYTHVAVLLYDAARGDFTTLAAINEPGLPSFAGR